MVAEVYGGIAAFKAALDITKTLKDIDNAARRGVAVIELQEKITTAQSAQASLVEEVDKLKKQVAEFETWDREKQRYKLQQIYTGGFAYVLKTEEGFGEEPHSICVYCYEHRTRSILQRSRNAQGRATMKCFACHSEVRLYTVDEPQGTRPPIRPDRVCPFCDGRLRLQKEYDHPIMGDLGLKVHEFKCQEADCGKEITRDFSPR